MILDTIVEQKQREVSQLLRSGFGDGPHDRSGSAIGPPRGFGKALTGYDGMALIAEAKKASPSKGVIRPDFDPVSIAVAYQKAGAQAVSVLTDETFFQGALDYIPMVRAAVDVPVLRKDFIVHEIQIQQAKAYGADAVLLIVAILDPVQLKEYLAMAGELGMDVLVEVHDEQEAEKALTAGSRLIGINNRDLRDFSVDLDTTLRVKREIPADIAVVSESGIREHGDIVRLADAGVKAVLVGETLMRAQDQAGALKNLMGR